MPVVVEAGGLLPVLAWVVLVVWVVAAVLPAGSATGTTTAWMVTLC